jgi:TolB protein
MPRQTLRIAIAGSRLCTASALLALALTSACDGDDPFAPAESAATDQTVAPTDPAPPAALVTAQRIAFSSKRNGQYDIYKMDPAGQNLMLVSGKADDEGHPAWSADNKRLALVRPRLDAANHLQTDIYIVNADGTNGHWARSTPTTCPLMWPSWSPSGNALALTMRCGNTYYVSYLNLSTGQLGAYSTGYGGLPGIGATYTKSGQIVYIGPTGKTVNRINADGTGHKTLYTGSAVMTLPALSPDGTRLLFVRTAYDGGLPNSDIYLLVLGTGKVNQLTTYSGVDSEPTWSPDGTRIAFISGRSGVSQIWTMNPTGGSLTRLTNTTTPEVDPAWSH